MYKMHRTKADIDYT